MSTRAVVFGRDGAGPTTLDAPVNVYRGDPVEAGAVCKEYTAALFSGVVLPDKASS